MDINQRFAALAAANNGSVALAHTALVAVATLTKALTINGALAPEMAKMVQDTVVKSLESETNIAEEHRAKLAQSIGSYFEV